MPEPKPRVVARAAKARATLLATGGRRIDLHLDAMAAARLDAHVARLGIPAASVIRLALMRWR